MPRHKGSINKVGSTIAIRKIWRFFVRRFLAEYTLPPDEKSHEGGVEAFFNLPNRRVAFCRASEAFTIPGPKWASDEQPYLLIPGVGKRAVPKGAGFVLRVDKAMPERNEIEFEDQVFVMSLAQLMAIKDRIKVIA